MSKRSWFAGVALGLAIFCPVLAQDVDQPISPSETQTEPATQLDVGSDFIATEAVPDAGLPVDETTTQQTDQSDSKDEDRDAPWSWSWLLLGDNLAQAIMAWASAIAALMASIAAGLLWATLRETRRSDERQTRAYLCAATNVVYNGPEGRFEFSTVVTNRGQTPAFDAQIAFEWTDEPFEEKFHSNLSEGSSIGMAGPGAEMHLHGHTRESTDPELTLTPERCEEIFRGGAPLVVYGRADYRDAFNIKRYTNFRYRFYNRGGKYGLAVCEGGNDAD